MAYNQIWQKLQAEDFYHLYKVGEKYVAVPHLQKSQTSQFNQVDIHRCTKMNSTYHCPQSSLVEIDGFCGPKYGKYALLVGGGIFAGFSIFSVVMIFFCCCIIRGERIIERQPVKD
uniref:Uncharacterized protein n=1 Tax=Acrobeloides nanus TaxID=290746 RepID=A0A914CK70_9BILA